MSDVTAPRIWRAIRVLQSLSSGVDVDKAFTEDGAAPASAVYRYASRDTSGPALVLLHGVTSCGAEDKRLVRLARILAREGVTSYVPHLSGLANFSEDLEDLSRIEQAILAASLGGCRRVSILGFSLGGGYGLVCAAKANLAHCIERVTVVGGHHQLDEVWSNMSARLNGLLNRLDQATETELYFALGCAAPRLGEGQLGKEGVCTLRWLLRNFCDGLDLVQVRQFALSHLLPHWRIIAACHSTTKSAELSAAGRLCDVKARVALLHAPDDELVPVAHAVSNFEELCQRGGQGQSLLSTSLFDHVRPRFGGNWREIPHIVCRFAELLP